MSFFRTPQNQELAEGLLESRGCFRNGFALSWLLGCAAGCAAGCRLAVLALLRSEAIYLPVPFIPPLPCCTVGFTARAQKSQLYTSSQLLAWLFPFLFKGKCYRIVVARIPRYLSILTRVQVFSMTTFQMNIFTAGKLRILFAFLFNNPGHQSQLASILQEWQRWALRFAWTEQRSWLER